MSETTFHRIWHESYPPGIPTTLEPYPEHSVYRLLDDSARRFPHRPALAFFGRHISYRDLVREVESLSAGLAYLGVERGDRVGFILPNCPQYVIAYYAAQRLGAVAVGNNPLYTQRELTHQLRDAGCRVVVALDLLYPSLESIRAELPDLKHVVVTGLAEYMKAPMRWLAPLKFRRDAKNEGRAWPPVHRDSDVVWWKDLMSSSASVPPVADVDARRDVAGLVYTGGTTGLAKGAMLSHYNTVANCHQAAAWFPGLEDGEEAVMCILPFFHSYGMTVEMNLGIHKAAKLVLIPKPSDLDMVLKAIELERPTMLPGIPRLYIAITEAAESRGLDISSIRACLSGAAKLPKAVAERFEAATGGRVVEGFGMTEASPIVAANPIDGRRKEGSVGLPVPDTDCRVVDLEDPYRDVDPGEEGELLIKGPQVMLGYWGRPEETAQVMPDEWFRTGDVVRFDEDGYIFIVDRIKEMIIVSGFNVYPTEVEEVLYRHPKVAKVAVIGVPDDKTGEAVKAFIVLRDGEEVTAEEIIDWCRDPDTGMTRYRVPKHIEFRHSLPETMTGKTLRRVLVAEERTRTGDGK